MKKLGSSRSLNKVRVKCEASSSLEFDQIKAGKTGWVGRLGDARRALSRKAKGFSPPSTSSSSTPCLFSTAPPPPKRAPSTTLTLRSKSMTAELEELGEYQKPCIQILLYALLSHFHFPFDINALNLGCSLLLACSCHFPLSADSVFFPPSFRSEKKRR